ncbi:MAG: type I-B CRISPR-associated protein Cas5b [Blastocatellia bacterium]|nr:type I-B CRISPR-associated protein Cas5b [Blastocatellia bacterium]
MKVARIYIRGWTASFRYPAFISGFQPTLPVPPLSTIYGLLSAAKGEMVTPSDARVGFVFQSHGKTVDLEAIYELHGTPLHANTNVVKRELLYEPELFLYVDNLDFVDHFRQPHYPLLLGRSTELAVVVKSEPFELEERSNVRIGGSIFPFSAESGVTGVLQSLPTHFTDEIPRRAIGTRPFCLVETDFSGKMKNKRPLLYGRTIHYDAENDWGVYMHG